MRPVNVHVERRPDEPIETMLKRFTRLVKKNEILDEVRERMFYVKPSKLKHQHDCHIKHVFRMQKLQKQEEDKARK